MANLTIHLPNAQYERLKQYAETRGIGVNMPIEELLAIALVEFDAHTRYEAMSVTGSPQLGLEIMDKLDVMTA